MFICEVQDSGRPGCAKNEYVHITYAMYGRLERQRCERINPPTGYECISKTSLKVTRQKCGFQKQVCQQYLVASNGWFGDPCPGIRKYLHIKYQCMSMFKSKKKRFSNPLNSKKSYVEKLLFFSNQYLGSFVGTFSLAFIIVHRK